MQLHQGPTTREIRGKTHEVLRQTTGVCGRTHAQFGYRAQVSANKTRNYHAICSSAAILRCSWKPREVEEPNTHVKAYFKQFLLIYISFVARVFHFISSSVS